MKGVQAEQVSHHLRKGEHRTAEYLEINPQGLVPSLVLDDGRVLSQSLAILEYLEETWPSPTFLPGQACHRARIRSAAQIIASDIHPIQNLKILDRVRALGGADAVNEWAIAVIDEGLVAFAKVIEGEEGPFCFGEQPTLADICLVPQLVNARRFDANWNVGRIADVEAACLLHPAFFETRPDVQPDAE
jgi:maleylpyruvate isomerase